MAVPSSGPLALRGDIALEVDGSATGTNVSLNTLSSSAGFTAPNEMTEFYGYSNSVVPSLSTSSMSSVASTSMTANGNVSSDGGATVTSRGFYFGTSSNYASNTKYTVGSGTGSFSNGFGSLSSQQTYYATAWAINSVGENRGSTVSATTSFDYQFRSIFIGSNSQSQRPGVGSYSVGSYYQNNSGSYVLHSTQTSSNAFLITGTNGRGYLIGSRINANRAVVTMTSASGCGNMNPTRFNYYNGIINGSYSFGGASNSYTNCSGTPQWSFPSGNYMSLNNYSATTGQSHQGNYTITAG
tara:strand:- start:780 stop:1673 length:894 start_codon:yes stop_codon:yes gene_type:complete